MEKKNKIKKCTRVFNHLEFLELSKAGHIALKACIYKLSTIGPHFIDYIVDPQNFGPIWSLYHDIESFVATEPPVFVASSVVASRFSVATFSLGLFLICVATYFFDVATFIYFSILVIVATEIPCVATPNLFAPSFSCPYKQIFFSLATFL